MIYLLKQIEICEMKGKCLNYSILLFLRKQACLSLFWCFSVLCSHYSTVTEASHWSWLFYYLTHPPLEDLNYKNIFKYPYGLIENQVFGKYTCLPNVLISLRRLSSSFIILLLNITLVHISWWAHFFLLYWVMYYFCLYW